MIRFRSHGFSLLEILVAFSILALSLGVLMRIFSSSLSTVTAIGNQYRATEIAKSLLASSGVEAPLAAGRLEGSVGEQYRWSVDMSRVDDEVMMGSVGQFRPSVALWQMTVRVAWGNNSGAADAERAISLTTLRLQPPSPP